jgi:hypothetical protein
MRASHSSYISLKRMDCRIKSGNDDQIWPHGAPTARFCGLEGEAPGCDIVRDAPSG